MKQSPNFIYFYRTSCYLTTQIWTKQKPVENALMQKYLLAIFKKNPKIQSQKLTVFHCFFSFYYFSPLCYDFLKYELLDSKYFNVNLEDLWQILSNITKNLTYFIILQKLKPFLISSLISPYPPDFIKCHAHFIV